MSAPLTITLPLPDHNLTLNRVGGRQGAAMRDRLVREHKDAARWLAYEAMRGKPFPLIGPDVPILIVVRVERRKRGQRWDAAGMIEACKAYGDGFQGEIYCDDKQIVAWAVLWDEKPTGAGVVHLEVRDARELLATLTAE